ncbi:MAG TPA: fructoselysine 6-kinase [Clostridiaceae bacterium]|nr:fructoselysine 6-kinase [Clostridiaceae bacterium]
MALRVIGIGDNVADHYLHTNMIYPGGNAFNFAAYAKMLGAEAAYMGVFGDDFPGTHVYNTGLELGICLDRCRIYHGENGCPKVKLENGERIFVSSNRGGVSRERPLTLDEDDIAYISTFQLIHTSINSYIEHNLPRMFATGVPISFDFSTYGSDIYFKAYCPYITYSIVSCGHLSHQETLNMISKLHGFGSGNVIATRGAEGSIFSDGHKIYHQKAHMVEAIDTMGAGDAYLTAFLLKYISWNLENKEKTIDHQQRETAILAVMEEASRFAAQICMIEGAFGHGVPYKK